MAMKLWSARLLGLFILCGTGCKTKGSSLSGELTPYVSRVAVQFGDDVDAAVRDRVLKLLGSANKNVGVLSSGIAASDVGKFDLILAFGDTAITRVIIDSDALRRVGPEGFVIQSQDIQGLSLIAARGNSGDFKNLSHGHIGNSYAIYAVLEKLGFAFLRPLAPQVPAKIQLPQLPLNVEESPRWRIRAMHLHTQHPLELTDFLQGFGPKGELDADSWQSMSADWDAVLEWLLANRQNRVEWALLWAKHWQEFADSSTRQDRLRYIVARGQEFGLAVGVDVPLTLVQQHAYHLIRSTGDLDKELLQLRERVDWLMGAKFDFIGTETGFSEFTHPTAQRNLAWMNELAKYTKDKYSIPTYIKVHCSTGQNVDGLKYPDPDNGKPINFNQLPHFAVSELGVLPHTVEHYGLDDPAPTYGNETFAYMRDFLQQEVGLREVVWYPETAYWVSFDIDVPLFLPVYGERRIHDLRLLAADEDAGRMGRGVHAGKRMDGQQIFSSGWEWGYWLNDVITARAAWNPHLNSSSDAEALRAVLDSAFTVFGQQRSAVINWINDVAAAQHELLIMGQLAGKSPKNIVMRSGQAYLQGFDTWDDVSSLARRLPFKAAQITQPERLGLVDLRRQRDQPDAPDFDTELIPLLQSMATRFRMLADQGTSLSSLVPSDASPLMADLSAAADLLALRAEQILGLYQYVGSDLAHDPQSSAALARARSALDAATKIVANREQHYAISDVQRVAGWRKGPTAYNFGYLWTVHSLYYWWRDEGKAVLSPRSPCYLNIINPVDVGFGEGASLSVINWLAKVISLDGDTRGCLDAPPSELKFPLDGLRQR